MRIAVLQFTPEPGAVAANLARLSAAAADAARQGARLLVAPELAVQGYGAGEALRELAEPLTGPAVRSLARTARETGCAIVAGFAERRQAQIYNSALFTDGTRHVAYAKCQLWGEHERAIFALGAPSPTIVEVGGLKLGLLVCYDVEFPEHVRRLARAGADLVAVPTALPEGPHAVFISGCLIQVRAFENQLFVAYADACGADARFRYAGRSQVAAPDGTTLAEAGGGEMLLLADIDRAAFTESRDANPYLRELRRGGD